MYSCLNYINYKLLSVGSGCVAHPSAAQFGFEDVRRPRQQ